MTRCYDCQKELRPEFGDTSAEEALAHEQWDNALVITFDGGYGMFVDPAMDLGRRADPGKGVLKSECSHKVVICHDCAHRLCEASPFIERLLDPLRSHSHRYDEDWTGHEGWDLPHREPEAVPEKSPAPEDR